MKTLFLLFFSVSGYGFIPNIQFVVRDVFEGRKPAPIEISIRHRIFNPSGEPFEVEEQILQVGGRYYFQWKTGGVTVGSEFADRKYRFAGIIMPARSLAFLKYLLGVSPDDYRDTLLKEQFIQRQQLQEFQPDFEAKGDPQTWNLKDSYLKHPEVAFKRVKGSPAVSFSGAESDGEIRSVFFDTKFRGVRRLEWKQGKETHAWNFDVFTKQLQGTFPKTMGFESNGAEIILSQVLWVRTAKGKAINEYRNVAKKAVGLSPDGENALRALLGYR